MLVKLGPYELAIPDTFGPRILGLRRDSSPELFAVLPDDMAIKHPEGGDYRFRGGHRLWVAPEVPQITYASDDEECELAFGRESVTVTGPADRAGLRKSLAVAVLGSNLVVDHTVTNQEGEETTIAPWAITQFRLGGLALMPLGRTPGGLQGDRTLTLWPYTDLADPRLTLDASFVAVSAQPGPAFKIGVGPNPVRLGYLAEGWLFTKEFPGATERRYADRGAVGQVFVEQHFCELESLGAITRLASGESVLHREVWSLAECDDIETARQRIVAV